MVLVVMPWLAFSPGYAGWSAEPVPAGLRLRKGSVPGGSEYPEKTKVFRVQGTGLPWRRKQKPVIGSANIPAAGTATLRAEPALHPSTGPAIAPGRMFLPPCLPLWRP